MAKVCMTQSNATLIVVLFLAIIALLVYHNKTQMEALEKRCAINVKQSIKSAKQQIKQQPALGIPPHVVVQNRNIERLRNPLTPPTRSDTRLPPSAVSIPISVPTRGEYGPFQMMGYLQSVDVNPADGKQQVMLLMGRRIHSNQVEYYTFHPDSKEVKIPIKQTKEFFGDETVTIEPLPGEFTVQLYDLDSPRYIPY